MRRSDLAVEAAELPGLKGKKRLPEGVGKEEYQRCGYSVTAMDIHTAQAAKALDKPRGRYVTVDLRPYTHRRSTFFPQGALCIAAELRSLLPMRRGGAVLVAGLGNRRMTADAVGPLALESLLVTRHLPGDLRRQFTPVMALHTGVSSQTGMETQELLRSVVKETSPAAVIVIDALAARNKERLCATVQLSDTGLTPGSGVGNHRCALNEETLGVPVIAVGVPTVMDAQMLCGEDGGMLFITARDIDSRVAELSRLLGYGITLALQPQLSVDDITGLLG